MMVHCEGTMHATYRYKAVRMESEMASLRVVTSWIHLAAAALRMWKALATLASDDTAAPLMDESMNG